MLDLNYVREHLEEVFKALENRGASDEAFKALKEFRRADEERRRAIAKSDQLNADRNEASRKIGLLIKDGKADEALSLRTEVSDIKEAIVKADKQREYVENYLRELLTSLPNVPHESVPAGRDESANREERQWGEAPRFDFEPQDHVDIGTRLGILDLERAAKIATARFAILRGAGARLERALINFMLDTHTREHGYEETLPSFIVNANALFGTGQLPKFEADLFKLTDERGLYLIPTAEVPVTNIH